eukprot:SAG31_NODE_2896_length_4936_cov_5.275377_2_plen_72_part_00
MSADLNLARPIEQPIPGALTEMRALGRARIFHFLNKSLPSIVRVGTRDQQRHPGTQPRGGAAQRCGLRYIA